MAAREGRRLLCLEKRGSLLANQDWGKCAPMCSYGILGMFKKQGAGGQRRECGHMFYANETQAHPVSQCCWHHFLKHRVLDSKQLHSDAVI